MPAQGMYTYKVVRQFAVMSVVWGVVGMLVGVIIAAQLYWPALNFDTPWFTYGRLRPLHTNAVIFAFGGCALFATSYAGAAIHRSRSISRSPIERASGKTRPSRCVRSLPASTRARSRRPAAHYGESRFPTTRARGGSPATGPWARAA